MVNGSPNSYLGRNSSRHQIPDAQLAVGVGAKTVNLASRGQQQGVVEAAREAGIKPVLLTVHMYCMYNFHKWQLESSDPARRPTLHVAAA